uniref:Uncharacterized protein n=1 Tax=viral metagenome TaxID=1070528 RepID=A0A6C0D0C6_9ZZZZ
MNFLFNILIYLATILLSSTFGKYMHCPQNNSMCGTIVIESGFGDNAYSHNHIGYHGLWISANEYGNSLCVPPAANVFDSNIHALCDFVNDPRDDYWFAKHEFFKHGICAGGSGPASVYFNTLCVLGSELIEYLRHYSTFADMHSAILNSDVWKDYLFDVDLVNKQFLMSICSTDLGYKWIFCSV